MNITPAALKALADGDTENFMVAATPGGIEAQEAAGQAEMASSFKTLPKNMDPDVAKKLGFKYIEEGSDDIFAGVEAPAGWSIRPTDHAMHSEILDDQQRVRGTIFYKAAFYDRSAHGQWFTRYANRSVYDENYIPTAYQAIDTATGEPLHSAPVPGGDEHIWEREEGPKQAVAQFLSDQYPNWSDPTAYW